MGNSEQRRASRQRSFAASRQRLDALIREAESAWLAKERGERVRLELESELRRLLARDE